MKKEEEIRFLPYEEAVQLVGAIQEEEDIHQENHRILTVYSHDDKELCWFDFEEVLRDAAPKNKAEEKDVVANYILHHIPVWVREI